MGFHSCRQGVRFLVYACVLLIGFQSVASAESVETVKNSSPFSMEFRDADIRDVIRAVGQAAHMNLIVSDTVTGQVTMSLKDVDVWDALESILKTKGLTYVREGGIVRVLAIADARDDDMETRMFPLGYANGRETLTVLDKIKSDRGKLSVDNRTNSIVVKDLSLNIDRMARLLKNLDARIPQIMIEAKIVEVSSNFARELGVQWGGQYSDGRTLLSGGSTGVNNNATPSGGGSSSTTPEIGSSTFYPQLGDIGRTGNAYVVNLPAAVGAGAGGALGVSLGKLLGGKLALDLQLSAMQSTGNGKVLSSPKVLTMNNKEARISSGTDIPVQIVSSTAVTNVNSLGVQTISANLMLSAIPTITHDNRIVMVLKIEKAEPNFSRQINGIPTIIRRSADAQLVVNNGETVVLGGILIKNESNAEASVPFLSKIPILGWFFKKKSKTDTQDELMIFITPTIVNE
ncbi:MAG: type IV pilus secretin PilQ [Nitrospirota bacterium]